LMRRRYAFDGYMEKIEKIRKKVEGVTFTTDIMVGFPGETAEDFNLSCRAIEIAGFIKVHIFRYSMRKETPAYYFAGHLPESVKKGREAELKYLAEETGSMVKKGFVDSFFDILAEKQCGEEWQGYSSNYIPAFFNSDKELANKIVRVKAKKVEGHKLFCVPV